jgi:hypothetical protein
VFIIKKSLKKGLLVVGQNRILQFKRTIYTDKRIIGIAASSGLAQNQ